MCATAAADLISTSLMVQARNAATGSPKGIFCLGPPDIPGFLCPHRAHWNPREASCPRDVHRNAMAGDAAHLYHRPPPLRKTHCSPPNSRRKPPESNLHGISSLLHIALNVPLSIRATAHRRPQRTRDEMAAATDSDSTAPVRAPTVTRPKPRLRLAW